MPSFLEFWNEDTEKQILEELKGVIKNACRIAYNQGRYDCIDRMDNTKQTVEKKYREIRQNLADNFNMPKYAYRIYQQFCVDMFENGLDTSMQHYRGRFNYEGPAVVVENISDATSKTSVPCQCDYMGKQYIVYPL